MVGDPPFDLPDIVTLAVPAFLALIVVEMIAVRVSRKGSYDAADTGASLAMGLGNSIAKVVFGGLAVAAYWIVFNWRLYDIPSPQGYAAAVAVEGDRHELVFHRWNIIAAELPERTL